jgi:hypothetical protein
MRDRVRPEWVGAIAGAALVVLVFLPWWTFDAQAAQDRVGGAEVAGYLDAFDGGSKADASPWDATPRGAIVWLAAGLLAVGVAVAAARGAAAPVRRALGAGTVLAGTVGLALAAGRLADPPYESYTAGTWAYAGLGATLLVAVSSALALRRA